jgi:type VI protein secretion system component VasK
VLFSKGKLIAGALILALAIGAGWKVANWRHDAQKLEAVEAQIEQYRHDLAVAETRAAAEVEAQRELNLDLESIRDERDSALDELDKKPLTVVKEITPECSCEALGAEFRREWNDDAGNVGVKHGRF